MAKEWKEGRNCVFTADFGGVKAGTGAWVFSVTATSVVFKTKEDATPPLEDVTIPEDQAENYVALRPGKPRKNWDFSGEPKPKKASAPKAQTLVQALTAGSTPKPGRSPLGFVYGKKAAPAAAPVPKSDDESASDDSGTLPSAQ